MARNTFLTRKGFRGHLAAHADNVVGRSRSSTDCPIATYLDGHTGELWYTSARECVEIEHPLVDFNTPRWARDFIKTLDREFPQANNVLGHEALYILDETVK